MQKLAWDLLINIINILILFVIVKQLAYKPVKKFLDARKERIASGLAEAEEKQKEADELKAEYEKKMLECNKKSEEIIKTAERKAEENSQNIIKSAEKQAEAINEKAKAEAQKTHDSMVAKMENDITSIAIGISEKILSRDVTDSDNRRIAEDFFAAYKGE